jgi:hypothetical protein
VVKGNGKGAGRFDISEIFCHENSQNFERRVPRDRERHTSDFHDVKSVWRRPQKEKNPSHPGLHGLSPEQSGRWERTITKAEYNANKFPA